MAEPDETRSKSLQRFAKVGKSVTVGNFDPQTIAGAIASITIEASDQVSLFDNTPEYVDCVFLTQREGESIDKNTGEVGTKIRTIMVDDAGKCWATNSGLVGRIANVILNTPAGMKPFDPPLRFSFERKRTGPDSVCLLCKCDLTGLEKRMG